MTGSPPEPTGPVPAGRDPDAYDRLRRRVLWSLPTGLFVVGSRAGERRNLMTANWVMQVAIEPKLVAVSIERGSVTRELIERGGGFSVSVLSRSDRTVVRRFVKPVEDVVLEGGVAVSMQGQPVREVAGGLPRIASALSWLACEVRRVVEWDGTGAGAPASHVLVVGEVVDAGEAPSDGVDGDGGPEPGAGGVLRMEDTRMNYGG
jgi:flavin reductase (DIM6/NTAB) family NADH-FMN oxidoreductase RutF